MSRVLQKSIFFFFAVSCCLVPATLLADDYEKVRCLLADAKARVDCLSDYTLTLTSQERVAGKLLPEATMFIKFKRPFSLYMKNLTGKNKNREIIYVKGQNNNKIVVSKVAILAGFEGKISPDSFWAKRESRHTISEAGLPNTMGRMVSILENGGNTPARRTTVTYLGEDYCSSKKVIRVRIENSSYAPRTELALDAGTLFPAEIVSFDTDGSLLESYRYRDIRANVGLSDADFDPKNPAYQF